MGGRDERERARARKRRQCEGMMAYNCMGLSLEGIVSESVAKSSKSHAERHRKSITRYTQDHNQDTFAGLIWFCATLSGMVDRGRGSSYARRTDR